ncbi:hypothetical protein [Pimelobacter simplex]|uniref:hypothetical protein n=1 Tax=Nocardioides simplex TaxID=2045 RepID=UPI003AAE0931
MVAESSRRLAAAADRAREIYPPEAYSPWWWLVVAGCVAGIVAVLWWARRAVRSAAPAARGDEALARLRAETLARLGDVERDHAAGRLGLADAHQRLSAEVRRFAGTATGGHADYRVLAELRPAAVRDPRLGPVVALVAAVQDPAFAGGAAPLAPLLDQAREVVRRWA